MSAQEKLAKLRAAAATVGAREVAPAPSKRPPQLDRMRAKAATAEGMMIQEIRRIVNLPIRRTPSEEEIEALSAHYFQRKAFDEGWRLMKGQAEALMAYNDVDGLFGPLAVGAGKTLTSLLIANDAYHKGVDKVMLIVPPALASQLCDVDIKHWRPLTIFNMPVHRLHGQTKQKRNLLAKSNRRGLYIYTYSLLQSTDAHELLEMIRPGLIILDEAHSVSRRSARTGRFNRYIHNFNPELVALSGTMTQKSLMDYFELARAALGQNNFMPNSPMLAEEWSKLIDSSATSMSDFRNDNAPNAGSLRYVVDWARDNFPDMKIKNSVAGFRNVFQQRLITSPGVVCSSGHELPYSLYIKNEPVKNPETYAGWDRLRELVLQLENEWLTPNGDEIEEAMHLFRWRYWIEGSGFYTERYWPEVEWMLEKGRYGSASHAKDILERSQEYHCNHMQYMRDLRKWIGNRARPGLDTPFLVGNEMRLHGADKVGQELYDSWRAWKDSDFEGRIDRLGRTVRVCGFKVEQAVRWAKNLPKSEGGLIWYDNDEMGDWAFERMVEEGLEPLMCKAGKQYNEMLNDRAKCKGRIIVLTINAHYQGKNLQFDRNQFYLQWPRSAARAEQAIGRQHRNGLEYDEVYVTTCHTTEFDRIQFAATLNDACYVDQSQGNRQKLIYGTYIDRPVIVPFEVLVQWGAQPERLYEQGKALLRNKFGME